jgi:hypothetical protein
MMNPLDLNFAIDRGPSTSTIVPPDIVFRFPDEEYGILGWNRPGDLYIYRKLIDNNFSFIPIEKTEIDKIISRYIGSRYNLEVRDTLILMMVTHLTLGNR